VDAEMDTVGPGGKGNVDAVIDDEEGGAVVAQSAQANRQLPGRAVGQVFGPELDATDAAREGDGDIVSEVSLGLFRISDQVDGEPLCEIPTHGGRRAHGSQAVAPVRPAVGRPVVPSGLDRRLAQPPAARVVERRSMVRNLPIPSGDRPATVSSPVVREGTGMTRISWQGRSGFR